MVKKFEIFVLTLDKRSLCINKILKLPPAADLQVSSMVAEFPSGDSVDSEWKKFGRCLNQILTMQLTIISEINIH